MEAKHSQRWKAFPDSKYSRRCLSLSRDDDKTERDRGGSHKSVTMAPTSRYLPDRRYVTRKPQFCSDQQTSILKKTNPPKHTEKSGPSGASRNEHPDDLLARSRVELTVDSSSLPHRDISPPSDSTKDHDSPMLFSEFMGSLGHEEPTFSSSRSTQLSLSGTSLEVQRPNLHLRPKLVSTVPYPHDIPCSGYSSPEQSQLRKGEGETRLSSNTGHSRKETMTPCQLNYWGCAIPKSLPPSPDRHSSDWDPNREYQALLDYTYPLKPGHGGDAWDNSELQEDLLLQTDLQDSGIEVGHLCSSTNLSGLDFSVSSTTKTKDRSPLGAGHRSPDLPRFTRSLDNMASSTTLSLKTPVGLSLDSLDSSNNRGGRSHYESVGQRYQNSSLTSHSDIFTSTAYHRSTSVLPRSWCIDGEVDEEFWPLPEQLEELQLLSKQVREVMVRLSQPVREPVTTSIFSSIALPEKRQAEIKQPEGLMEEVTDDVGREESTAQQIAAAAHGRTSGASVEAVGDGDLTGSSLTEVEELIKQLCGLALPHSRRRRQEEQQQSDSLMRHIQVFCSHLEQLIQRLYTVSEKMELLSAPTVDIGSVKSSLAEYQSFQREVSSHQPLTSRVLQTGQLLLTCINTTSPFLSDALLLIERQSRALQTRTEHFLSSILSAMDSLTQPTQPTTVEGC